MFRSDEDYYINVDNDEIEGAENAITLFVNCKIHNESGELMGVVGVGVQIGYLHEILEEYHEEFDVNACFTDEEGLIALSAEHNGYEKLNFFQENEFDAKEQKKVQSWKKDTGALEFWKTGDGNNKKDYIIVRYVPDISWHLIVESDTEVLMKQLHWQFIVTVLILLTLVAIILLITTRVIGGFNQRIVQLTRSYEQERKTIFEKATEQLFENIYELDITNNRPANKETEEYFISMGAPAGTSYDESLKIIAEKQIKSEFRKDYVNMFSTENILQVFQKGVSSLRYDFMISSDGENYYWMRITARLIVSDSDGSLHMLTYRQNIDEEKKREQKMREMASRDEMTGFLNKISAEKKMEEKLDQNRDKEYTFFIFDIDRFKQANDLFGHAFGDSVIRKFASILRDNFEEDALIGRIGGDEFAVLMEMPDKERAVEKAHILKNALNLDYREGFSCWHISVSIGVAFVPQDGNRFDTLYHRADAALYGTKRRGRRDFTLYEEI